MTSVLCCATIRYCCSTVFTLTLFVTVEQQFIPTTGSIFPLFPNDDPGNAWQNNMKHFNFTKQYITMLRLREEADSSSRPNENWFHNCHYVTILATAQLTTSHLRSCLNPRIAALKIPVLPRSPFNTKRIPLHCSVNPPLPQLLRPRTIIVRHPLHCMPILKSIILQTFSNLPIISFCLRYSHFNILNSSLMSSFRPWKQQLSKRPIRSNYDSTSHQYICGIWGFQGGKDDVLDFGAMYFRTYATTLHMNVLSELKWQC
jgi:hypothetical protein